ncbi:hypothetical protein GCM10022291_34880 [Postechiella marina]|uniref:Lipoprotein n=1 Tax=Postechiella marina TaxID=943941 RepID=A0ABP8CIX5_9FLAO
MKKILLLLSFFSILTACDAILDEVVECIVNRRPVLSNNKLDSGRNDTYYSNKIWAEIKNEPKDDNYYYNFSYRGDLPNGINIIFEDREVYIEGVPRETGRFKITIHVSVDARYYNEDGDIEDPLCSSSDSKTYTLIIR